MSPLMKPRFTDGSKWVDEPATTKGRIVVEMTLVEVRAAARSYTTVELRRASRRAECTTFVDLARRMTIGSDEAIRQFMDLNQRRAAEAQPHG